MIDKEALNFLESRLVAASNPQVKGLNVPGDTPYLVLPDGVVPQSLEKFLASPVRYRGTFTTRRISDFVKYIQMNMETVPAKAGLFIDPDAMTGEAILDLGLPGSPGWCEHTAILTPKELPAYAALTSRNLKEFSQLEFIDFIADWETQLRFFTEEDLFDHGDVVKAVRNISVQAKQGADTTVGNFKAERSTMEAIDIQSKDGMRLPEGFIFSCRPYDELSFRKFTCRLRGVVDSTRNTAKLFYRITELDITKLLMADEFLKNLEYQLQKKDLSSLCNGAHIGTFKKGSR